MLHITETGKLKLAAVFVGTISLPLLLTHTIKGWNEIYIGFFIAAFAFALLNGLVACTDACCSERSNVGLNAPLVLTPPLTAVVVAAAPAPPAPAASLQCG